MARPISARPVYLLDFSVYKPPEDLRMNVAQAEANARESWSMYTEASKDFMVKVFEKSGISPTGTYLPPTINPCVVDEPRTGIPEATQEARMVMFGAVSDLLEKTGTPPSEIDIVITNCSIFCPTPSLASMLVNHFKLRRNVQSYHLGGMGCGNGVCAIGLVRDLLQARPNAKALFVPAEITTYCYYPGTDKKYMVANCIFRMGGAAALFTNKPGLRRTAKYELLHSERVHTGADDGAFACMGWQPDAAGVNGVYLGKDVVQHAGAALQHCLTVIMTWTQYGEAALNAAARAVYGPTTPAYAPDFTRSIVKHFAIHAGGYAVLKGIQKGMALPALKMLPSFAALRDYGNTSCSTTWYIMAYHETCGNVKRGEVVMQIGMGGGMKAGVNVWRALRDNRSVHAAWRHLMHKPLTEADLPRGIDEAAPAAAAAARKAEAEARARAEAAAAAKAKGVARRPTVDVFAVQEQESG
ncbi:MAG: FAE1/Type III polyketide synthase-like protein-domain-containing protein [Monoraphidium minutum]|nr:MAG: FAE1/Type III polyketide synthase-like protein-domain-containing protein [Monoraphidium minutum]